MSLLLDTHTLLWSLFDPDQLSAGVKSALLDPEERIHVSVVSYWEISLKYALGKLTLTNVLPDDLPSKAARSGFETLVLDANDAASFHALPRLAHKDSFDRLIVWQAIRRDLTLVSKDQSFEAYRERGLRLLW